MKYKDEHIVLVRSDNIYKFKDLLPSNGNYMYLKVLNNGKILISRGKFVKTLFNLKNIENKFISDVKIEFFNDYIDALLEKVKEDHTAYQFNFQYKDDIILYSCSIYPCMVYEECKSFDIIVRQNSKNNASNDVFRVL